MAVHPADKKMAKHALAHSTWITVDITDEPDRAIFHLLDRRAQRVPNDRGDQAASEVAAVLNSYGVKVTVIALDARVPEPQALSRWRIKYSNQDVTAPSIGPSAIYIPEDGEAEASLLLNDPAITRRGDPVDIDDSGAKRGKRTDGTSDKSPWWERAERWVLLALLSLAFGCGIYVAIGTPWKFDKLVQFQYRITIAVWAAIGATILLVVWHLVCRYLRATRSEEWKKKYRTPQKKGKKKYTTIRHPIRVIEAMLRVDAFPAVKTERDRSLRRSNFLASAGLLAIMAFLVPTTMPPASGVAIAALAGVAGGLALVAGAWQSWRQVSAPPRIALGVVGFGTILASVNVLTHIVADTYFEQFGIPHGAINESYSTLILISMKPLGLMLLVAVITYVVWLLLYRNRFAEPQNWLFGLMFILAAVGIGADTMLKTAVAGAAAISSGHDPSSNYYSATPVCVVPVDRSVNPLGIGNKPKLFWKIGDYGTQVILLDPNQAKKRHDATRDGEWRPAPVVYLTASAVVYTVAAGEDGPC